MNQCNSLFYPLIIKIFCYCMLCTFVITYIYFTSARISNNYWLYMMRCSTSSIIAAQSP